MLYLLLPQHPKEAASGRFCRLALALERGCLMLDRKFPAEAVQVDFARDNI